MRAIDGSRPIGDKDQAEGAALPQRIRPPHESRPETAAPAGIITFAIGCCAAAIAVVMAVAIAAAI